MAQILRPPFLLNHRIIDSADFWVPLADAGAGAVNLAVGRGVGPATFTRATTATTVNSSGTIISVATGVARSWYDPTTLAYGGYLAEGARTNLCLQSEDLATTWSVAGGGNSSVNTNSAIAPDGATTADTLVEDSSSGQHFINQGFTKDGSAIAYTCSVWAKPAGRNFCGVRLDDFASNGARCDFTLVGSGAASAVVGLGTPFTSLSAEIKSYANGWYRCTLSATSNTATALRIVLQLESASGTISYQGNGTSGVYFWGAQLEAASFASSYIPTTTAAVTRNADVLTYPASGNISDTQGTVYAEAEQSTLSGNRELVSISDGTTNERYSFYINVSGAARAETVDGGVQQSNVGTANIITVNTAFKAAHSYALNNFAISLNGGSVTTDLSGTLPTVTTIGIGIAAGVNNRFGTLRNVRIWTSQLPDASLQALTA